VERAVACALLEVVYDASPVVRCAAALRRAAAVQVQRYCNPGGVKAAAACRSGPGAE
jgi:hypothetical protein